MCFSYYDFAIGWIIAGLFVAVYMIDLRKQRKSKD